MLSVSVYPTYQLLNAWTNLYETCYVYHGTWAHLNDILHKSLPSVCVSSLSLLGNGSVYMFPLQPIHASFSMRFVSYERKVDNWFSQLLNYKNSLKRNITFKISVLNFNDELKTSATTIVLVTLQFTQQLYPATYYIVHWMSAWGHRPSRTITPGTLEYTRPALWRAEGLIMLPEETTVCKLLSYTQRPCRRRNLRTMILLHRIWGSHAQLLWRVILSGMWRSAVW
jgi:hypothetical protein